MLWFQASSPACHDHLESDAGAPGLAQKEQSGDNWARAESRCSLEIDGFPPCVHVGLLEANCRPWGPPQEMSRELEEMGQRLCGPHGSAEFTAERRGRVGIQQARGTEGPVGVTASLCKLLLGDGEEMNKA